MKNIETHPVEGKIMKKKLKEKQILSKAERTKGKTEKQVSLSMNKEVYGQERKSISKPKNSLYQRNRLDIS